MLQDKLDEYTVLPTQYHFKPNTIYCGDNLEVLQSFPDECVDLIYIDPPFMSGRNYDLIFDDKFAVRAFEDTFNGSMDSYIRFMELRIREIYRVLKPTGSFYLHCDYHADSYLRILCDKIFGYDNLQNSIVWCYRSGGASEKRFGRKHDTILFYTKSKKYTFNMQKEKSYMGLNYSTGNENVVLYDDKDGKGKYTLVNQVDWWKISMLATSSKERLGYPTQKPEALLERIIKASSNEGDIVLDAFCGCGTTLSVAKKLNRKYVGIDVSPIGCTMMAQRIGYKVSEVVNMKYMLSQLKEMNWMAFQKWSCKTIGGVPLTKKGSDGGIDGWQSFNKFGESVPIEVKQHSVGRPDVQKFQSVLQREKKKGGFMVGLHITKTAMQEADRIKNELGLEIVFVTPDNIDSVYADNESHK